MKKTVFLAWVSLCLLMSSVSAAFAQTVVETRVANLVTGDYATQGTVYLELLNNGALQVRFGADYQTQSNVYDVHVYLTNSNNYNSPINLANTVLVENIGTISGINYSSGADTFHLPATVGLNDYAHIVLVCVQFGRLHWAHGDFGLPYPNLSPISDYCSITPPTPNITLPTGTILGVPNVSFPITQVGTNTVVWTFSDGQGNNSTSSQQVTVNALPSTIRLVGNQLSLDNPTMGASYQWLDCGNNNAPISGATAPTFVPMANGTYALQVRAGSCTQTSNCLSYTITNLTEVQEEAPLQLYPNPSQGVVQISSSSQQVPLQVVVTTVTGQIVRTQALPANGSLTVDALPQGVYVVSLLGANSHQSAKLVVE